MMGVGGGRGAARTGKGQACETRAQVRRRGVIGGSRVHGDCGTRVFSFVCGFVYLLGLIAAMNGPFLSLGWRLPFETTNGTNKQRFPSKD